VEAARRGIPHPHGNQAVFWIFKLNYLVAQGKILNYSRRRLREFVHETAGMRHLVMIRRDLIAAERDDFIGRNGRAVFELNSGANFLAVLLVGNTEHADLSDSIEVKKISLDAMKKSAL
jgi:hypothetical protein